MKELLSQIKVKALNGMEEKTFTFTADPFYYNPQITHEDGGILWNCDKIIIIELPTEEVLEFFSIERSCIVHVRTSNRVEHSIGTRTIPAKVSLSSNINSASLIIRCKMLKNPF